MFLSLLATAVASGVTAHLRVGSDLKWGAVSRGASMYALANAMTVIHDDKTPTFDALGDTWANDDTLFKDVLFGEEGHYSLVSEEGGGKRYGLTDENAKVSLNKAPSQVLSLLFRAAGMTSVAADDLASFIVDWRDENTVAEGGGPSPVEVCATLSAPYGCKNADFEVLEELWLMPEMTAILYNSIRGELTLYGSGSVNVNTATPLALRAVGLSEAGAEGVVQWRSLSGNFFENPAKVLERSRELGLTEEDRKTLISATSAGLLGTRSDAFRGEVEVGSGRVRRGATFIVDRTGEVKLWRE